MLRFFNGFYEHKTFIELYHLNFNWFNLQNHRIFFSFFMVFFLFSSLHFLIKLIVPVAFVEMFVMKITFWISFSYFVEIIHVQLNKNIKYLPHKRRVIAMLKVLRQNYSWKLFLVCYDKANTIWCPFDTCKILLILHYYFKYI